MNFLILLFWFVMFLVLPGFLLYNLIFEDKQEDVVFYLPLFFVFSLVFLAPLGLFAYFFNWSWVVFSAIFFSLLGSLLLLSLFRRKSIFKLNLSFDWLSKLVLLILVSSAVFVIFVPPVFDFTDAPFHVGQIRKLVEINPISPVEAFIPTGKISPPYGFNIWYITLALLSKWANLDLLIVWGKIAIFLVPISLGATYFFGSKLFQDRRAGLVVLIVSFALTVFVFNALDFRTIAYPRSVTQLIILPVALGLFFEYLRQNKPVYFLASISLGFLITTIHLFAWVHMLIVVSAFGGLNLLLNNRDKFLKSFKVVIAVLLLPLPYLLLLKLQDLSSTTGLVEATTSRDIASIFLGYLKNPRFSGALIILLALMVKYWSEFRKNIWLVFLVSNALVFLIVFFTPPLYSLISQIVSKYYVLRLPGIFPTNLIWAAAFFAFFVKSSPINRTWEKRIFLYVSIILVFGLFSLPFTEYKGSNSFKLTGTFGASAYPNIKIIEYIKRELPREKIFAAPYRLSYWIPVYSYNYVVMTYPDHTTFTVNREERANDLGIILSGEVGINETLDKLIRYEVNYVVLPKTSFGKAATVKFKDNPAYFEKLYEDRSYILFSVK